jgi:hypothetical protein
MKVNTIAATAQVEAAANHFRRRQGTFQSMIQIPAMARIVLDVKIQ